MGDGLDELFLGNTVLARQGEVRAKLVRAIERDEGRDRDQATIPLRKLGALPDVAVKDAVGQIGELLGESPDSSRLYRGIRALAGRTCLVERVSRQIWRLALAGITPAAALQRSLARSTGASALPQSLPHCPSVGA